MTRRYATSTVVAALILAVPPVLADVWATAVEFFTAPDLPAVGVEALRTKAVPVETFDLAAPRRIEASLSAGLPANESGALALARQRLEGQGGGFVVELQTAYEGHARALSYGLTRYPAIVFDRGAAVVYGTADLGEALGYYRTWKRQVP